MARCPSCKAPIGRVQTLKGNEMQVESGAVKIQAHIPDTPRPPNYHAKRQDGKGNVGQRG